MKKFAKFFAFFIATVLLAASTTPSAAEEPERTRTITIRPRVTQPTTRQQVVIPVLRSVIPGAEAQYERNARDPNVQPNYQNQETYQNPVSRHIEPRTPETLNEAQRWLAQPQITPDRNRARPSTFSQGQQTQFFTGRTLVPSSGADAQNVISTYGSVPTATVAPIYPSIPTGMVLEGRAIGINAIDDLQYDAILNALVINNSPVYFSPVAPQSLAALCRALERDDRVGVALGDVEIIYGDLSQESRVGVDLKLADNFLGNIVFGQAKWLPANYPLAGNYVLQTETSVASNIAVMFKFKDFRFNISGGVVRATATNFEVRLIPFSDQRAEDGGVLPDYEAIARGAVSLSFYDNADHVTNNIDYYRRETFVDNAFRHGEVAALIRSLKAGGVDLQALAGLVEQATGVGRLISVGSVANMGQPINQLFAAWRSRDLQLYLDQWSPDAVQIGRTKTSRYSDIQNVRARIFPQLGDVSAVNLLIYLGYQNGFGVFRNQYTLQYDSTTRPGSSCEIYKVRYEGGRWLIVENLEDAPC